MNSLFMFVLAMAGSSQQGGQGGNPIGALLPIILIFGIMYLLIFRPQAKKQKEHKKMLESVEKGDNIVTIGGIYGTVVGLKKDNTVMIVKIADNVKVEMTRSSIARKIVAEEEKN